MKKSKKESDARQRLKKELFAYTRVLKKLLHVDATNYLWNL